MLTKWAKRFAWWLCRLVTRLLRILATLRGRRSKVDVIIYKVDRMGDWLLAEPAVARIVASTRAKGGTVVVWLSRESMPLRKWRQPDFPVESFVFEPKGPWAKLRRVGSVMRLLAVYRAETLICLRHGPDPIRDFALATAEVDDVRALSWLIYPGPPTGIPHEITRHQAILAGIGLAPADVRDLLPTIAGRTDEVSRRAIIAPFSSALIRDWPLGAWEETVGKLAHHNLFYELWVGPDQVDRAKELARVLARRVGEANVAIMSGPFGEMGAAVAGAALVLSVDTFAAHLAVAYDVPTVCLMGGGQFGDFAPWRRSARQQWVYHQLPCFGCGWNCTRSRVECMEDISPAAIIGAVNAVWQADEGNKGRVAMPGHS